jgi:transcriptional regulator with XRE-family HTH domain
MNTTMTNPNPTTNVKASAPPIYDFTVLRQLRKTQGLTITELAEASGISTAVISRLERNQALPELETLARLARAFGMTAADLLGIAESRSMLHAQAQHYSSGGFSFHNVAFPNAQCFVGSALAGSKVNRPEVHHNDLEICWVLQGTIEFTCNGQRRLLREGEAVEFDAVQRHEYRAVQDCRLVLVHIRKGRHA